jgi:hypothetical protein
VKTALRVLLRAPLALGLLGIAAWGGLALWLRAPLPEFVRAGLVLVVALLALRAAWALLIGRGYRRLLGFALALVMLVAWWSTLRPRNDRDWQADVARPPTAEFNGDLVTIHNVRNFDYRSETDYDEHWETRTYDLSKLVGVDLFLSHWSSPAIAHTLMSWEFSDDPPLVISIETRKEKGESYSAVRGFFRDYELYYVIADERDLVRLRTNYRGEQVYLYRLRVPVETARALLIDYLEEANRLATHPRWYNAATHNCTTAIRKHVQHVSAGRPFDWRIIVNGYLDELMYERETIDTSRAFVELKRLSDVTARGKAADKDPDFAKRIREGIAMPPAPRQ